MLLFSTQLPLPHSLSFQKLPPSFPSLLPQRRAEHLPQARHPARLPGPGGLFLPTRGTQTPRGNMQA